MILTCKIKDCSLNLRPHKHEQTNQDQLNPDICQQCMSNIDDCEYGICPRLGEVRND